jgi:predicted phage terminase large subunit-like protein
MEFIPQPGRQEQFLSSPADIVIYGGAAGGGKTWGLLLEAMRYRDVPAFTCSIFRRSYPEITNLGGLWDESEKIYKLAGGQSTKGELLWTFRSGDGPPAQIEFNHLQNDDALSKYDGAQLALICFDQLEHFTEKMFWYLFIRNRSLCGVQPYIRATCNPDPDSFLVNGPSGWGSGLISWWIDEDGYANLDRAGVIRWFVRVNETLYWGASREELLERFPGKFPKSITFIPATVYDNAILLANNPEYLANLEALPLVERERFLGDKKRGGNWKIKAEAGKVFNREWFEIVPDAPGGGIEGDGWDIAATLKSLSNDDPDYTSRVRMRKVRGSYYVLGMFMERYAAGEIDNLMLTTSQQDRAQARAAGVTRFIVRWEIEPGSAGQRVNNSTIRLLAGFEAAGVPITGDKVTRAKPMAAQAVIGNIKLVAGPWNDAFLSIFHSFPDGKHDDPIDAASVIFNALAEMPETQVTNAGEQTRQAIREVFNS